jgi:hypothetical protein
MVSRSYLWAQKTKNWVEHHVFLRYKNDFIKLFQASSQYGSHILGKGVCSGKCQTNLAKLAEWWQQQSKFKISALQDPSL